MPRYIVATPVDGHGTAGLYLGSAMTPTFTRSAGSYQSAGKVYGSPGTAQVGMPNPGVASTNPVAQANGGTRSSDYSPKWGLPSVYYENDGPLDKEHAPVQFMNIDAFVNVLPVPAERPANALIADPFRAHVGGARQIIQPQVVPVWMGRNGTVNG